MFNEILITLGNSDVFVSVERETEYDGSIYYGLRIFRKCETFQKLSRRRHGETPKLRTYRGPEDLARTYVVL